MGHRLEPWQEQVALALEARQADLARQTAALQDAINRTLAQFAQGLGVEATRYGLMRVGEGMELVEVDDVPTPGAAL